MPMRPNPATYSGHLQLLRAIGLCRSGLAGNVYGTADRGSTGSNCSFSCGVVFEITSQLKFCLSRRPASSIGCRPTVRCLCLLTLVYPSDGNDRLDPSYREFHS